jgi:hypothetical protein
MTMKPIRCLFQPPTQQTSQSPNREPSVTAVPRRRNLVSGSISVGGHHIDPSLRRHSQLALCSNRWENVCDATCFPAGESAYPVPHAQNAFPANPNAQQEDSISAGPLTVLAKPVYCNSPASAW